MFRGRSYAAALLFMSACCALSLVRGQEAQRDVRYYADEARKAYAEKNYAAYLENLRQALALRPGNPTLLYNLAGAYALTGNKPEALSNLARVAEMGLVYSAEADGDFDSVKETGEFKSVLARFAANRSHVGRSATAFTIPEKGLITEGIAYDSVEDAFYLSSVRARKVFKVKRGEAAREFATERDGLWSAMGMKVDARRRVLWVASAAVPPMSNYRKEEDGQSGLLKFDLKTGKLIQKYTLPNRPRPHWLGDLVVNSRGDVFATDSLTPALYVLREGAAGLQPLIEGAPFVSPQGLAFTEDERALFLADYSKGLFLYDVKTGTLAQLSASPAVALPGIDGLYFYKGALVAIQNGTRPHRVVRISLSKDLKRADSLAVLEANNPLFDEPTLGVVVKDEFYYVADSQWGALDRTGKLLPGHELRDTLILKMKL